MRAAAFIRKHVALLSAAAALLSVAGALLVLDPQGETLPPALRFGAPASSQGGPRYTAGTNITISAGNVISATTSAGSWATMLSDPLTGGALTGYTARACTWTATVNGFQVDDGGTECYLSIDSGSPFPYATATNYVARSWAIKVEFQYTASAGTTNDTGFVLSGSCGGAVAGGFVRAFARKDGSRVGFDIFGAGTFGWATAASPPSSGWHTLSAEYQENLSFTIALDGVPVFQAAPGGRAGLPNPLCLGLWSNPGHAMFRNLKTYLPLPPSL